MESNMAKIEQTDSEKVQTAVLVTEINNACSNINEVKTLLKEHISLFSAYIEKHNEKHERENLKCETHNDIQNAIDKRLALVEEWKTTSKEKPTMLVAIGGFILAFFVAIWNVLKG
jgi:hypothetical protein